MAGALERWVRRGEENRAAVATKARLRRGSGRVRQIRVPSGSFPGIAATSSKRERTVAAAAGATSVPACSGSGDDVVARAELSDTCKEQRSPGRPEGTRVFVSVSRARLDPRCTSSERRRPNRGRPLSTWPGDAPGILRKRQPPIKSSLRRRHVGSSRIHPRQPCDRSWVGAVLLPRVAALVVRRTRGAGGSFGRTVDRFSHRLTLIFGSAIPSSALLQGASAPGILKRPGRPGRAGRLVVGSPLFMRTPVRKDGHVPDPGGPAARKG
jgi:hypothetical protein